MLCGLGAAEATPAQDAAYFTPTYAASRGSPYREAYARSFGAPLETAAPPATAAEPPGIVYVIEDGQLLTYSPGNYASGGPASSRTALPVATQGRLYGVIPPQLVLGAPHPRRKPR